MSLRGKGRGETGEGSALILPPLLISTLIPLISHLPKVPSPPKDPVSKYHHLWGRLGLQCVTLGRTEFTPQQSPNPRSLHPQLPAGIYFHSLRRKGPRAQSMSMAGLGAACLFGFSVLKSEPPWMWLVVSKPQNLIGWVYLNRLGFCLPSPPKRGEETQRDRAEPHQYGCRNTQWLAGREPDASWRE